MRIVKLDAIPSTNDFLREMSRSQLVENFTVVTAESQTSGKGQRGASWVSEPGKNLTVSVFIDKTAHFTHGIFSMNVAVAVAIFTTLRFFKLNNLAVKWPNDIMADEKKLGGILIENALRSDGTFTSIIGVGLNINQTDFSSLPAATSIARQLNYEIDKDEFLKQLLCELQITLAPTADQVQIWDTYKENLFRRNVHSNFERPDGTLFTGIIEDVNHNGQLIVNSDGNLYKYSLKEVKLLY